MYARGSMDFVTTLATTDQTIGSTIESTDKAWGSRTFYLHSDCIRQDSALLARSFPDRSNRSWAIAPVTNMDDTYRHHGIMLVKVPKSASSTSAGVALRISERHGNISVTWKHDIASVKDYGNRHPTKSFLFGSVRDPASRTISHLSFAASLFQQTPITEDQMLARLQNSDNLPRREGNPRLGQSQGRGGPQIRFMSLQKIPKYALWDPTHPTTVQNVTYARQLVKDIIHRYDFLLLVERMDESLVAMSMVMGVDVGDLLVVSSKIAGTYYYVPQRRKNPRCVKLQNPQVTETIQAYVKSKEWYAMNYGDYLLHSAVNKSLDLTIDRLGRHRFESTLRDYRRLKAMVDTVCANQIHLPCSSKGRPQPDLAKQSCYATDIGCGFPCIDNMLGKEG